LAVLVLVIEGALHLLKQRQRKQQLELNIKQYSKRLGDDEEIGR
jgi:chloramphenicol-sensitive protein RarD